MGEWRNGILPSQARDDVHVMEVDLTYPKLKFHSILGKGWRGQLCRNSGPKLPPRYSHFLMKGGDILTLQRILGHSDIKLTMRYAHLCPRHLEGVTELSPLG